MDQGFMHYIAYLINEHGFVPYRDIFELNMPVSYLFHMAVGKFFGYSDQAFSAVNIAWLTATFAVTWLIMKPFGRVIAFTSCLLFGIVYLRIGSLVMLQRDLIAILPMATALLITTGRTPLHRNNLINFFNGVLFAIAALIKPHLVIGLPAMIIYNCTHSKNRTNSLKTIIKECIIGGLFALLGFIITLVIPLLWLWKIGAIEAFWNILSSYIPLYGEISGKFTIVESDRTVGYLLYNTFDSLKQSHTGGLLITALLGVGLVLKSSLSVVKKKLALLLFSLTLLYVVYVVIGGKFWIYHWMPFMYFACLCTPLLLLTSSSFVKLSRTNIIRFFLFIFLALMLTVHPIKQILYNREPLWLSGTNYYTRVEEIETYLNKNLSLDDKVQPLDWIAGGSVQAMLLSKAVVATPYVTDFQFYHHVSNPYIQSLRKNFITELEKEMPKFIIKVETISKISGTDTNYSFPKLEEFIKQHYSKDYIGTGFDIYRRDDESRN
ncbi:hypothetical protein VB620_07895 [Nodularia harveyana UHCC-0300]|uniref:Glycosyltransferase RgtA/B/C/D-like domain-containing protein n=1 Tax=Nodularia harveyana UHCC-0300 TaxID=2974287 RepID=A0ABU5UCJ6_9CYAN|nr:hypothetical protein [Nodularia harveyana]MEA5581260.1 hypothetical protein [Nodularia harveyana UHCC-0300]